MNISVAIVGRNQPFKILDDDENMLYLNMAKERGATIVPVRSDDDSPSSTGDDDKPDPALRDPDVLVATMEHCFLKYCICIEVD